MDTDQYQFYKNAQYRNTRNKKKILILDVDDSKADASHLGAGGEFNIDLFEPLIIDKHSEVYLDNFISFNSNISNITANSAFVLKINEFNINSNVASSTNNNDIFNSIVIPNEHNTVSDNHGAVLHKAKKFNYICDINPGKIGRISGKITNLAGKPIFHGLSTNHRFTYTLTGFSPTSPSPSNVGLTTGSSGTITIMGPLVVNPGATPEFTLLANHSIEANTLHFSSNLEITTSSNPGDIVFTFTSTSPIGTLTIGFNPSTSINPGLLLIQTNARFIAEFLIISRE